VVVGVDQFRQKHDGILSSFTFVNRVYRAASLHLRLFGVSNRCIDQSSMLASLTSKSKKLNE
jgi:hypothetical protein